MSNSPLDTYEIIVYNDIGNPPATVPKGKKYNNNNFPECNRTFQTLYPNNDKLFHINFGWVHDENTRFKNVSYDYIMIILFTCMLFRCHSYLDPQRTKFKWKKSQLFSYCIKFLSLKDLYEYQRKRLLRFCGFFPFSERFSLQKIFKH